MHTPLPRFRKHLTAAVLVLATAGAASLAVARVPRVGGTSRPIAHAAADRPGARPEAARARAILARRPLAFEANRGQADARHRFLARGPGYQLAVAPTEIALGLTPAAPRHGRAAPPAVVRLRLEGANPAARVEGETPLPGTVNYFLGNDPEKWRTHVPTYQQVRVAGVYPGIDVVHYGSTQGELEHDFVVAPGADPDRIRLTVEGARDVKLDEWGDLVVALAGGAVRQRKPVAYQEIAGRREPVAAAYVLKRGARPEVRLALGEYDRSRPLVIDPTLAYSTYFGGNNTDVPYALRVDGAGNFYVVGVTQSSNFPVVSPIVAEHVGGIDICITKLEPFGETVLFSTYLGGSSSDTPYAGLKLGPDGSLFVAGDTTSTDLPAVGAFQSSHAGGTWDAFLVKLTPTGDRLVFSTYLGGTSGERGFTNGAVSVPRMGLAVDAAGSAYLVGNTSSTNFPLRVPIQATLAGDYDLFITKFAPAGNDLVYSTYFGGTGHDLGAAAAVDAAGALFAAGETGSADFPLRAAADSTYSGGFEGIALKLNPDGRDYAYSTYLGGGGNEYVTDAGLDGAGALYLTGGTDSNNFPLALPFQTTRRGAADAFLSKLTPTGNGLVYSTYIGGSTTDYATALHVDGSGVVTLAGATDSTDFPTQNAIFPNRAGTTANADAFFFQMKADGSGPLFSTYFGGSAGEEGTGVAVAGGTLYGAGYTNSANLPTVNAYDDSPNGGADFFLLRITAEPLPGGPTGLTATASGTTINLAWADNSNNETGFQVFRKTGNASFVKLPTGAPADVRTFQDSGLAPGTFYTYKVRAVNNAGFSPFSNEAQTSTPSVTLRVTAPNGGENWSIGSQQNITWTITGGSAANVKIEVQRASGGPFEMIAPSAPGSGTFSWMVSGPVTTTARVKVSDAANAALTDTSDANFAIVEVPRSLTLTAPNGGEQWSAKSARTLTWASTGSIANVKLELSTDGGATYPTVIAASAPNAPSGGSFAWTVQDTPSSTARVRVSDAADAAVKDDSNANFSITAASPAGDVNGDGNVGPGDLTVLINIILGRTESNPRADVNGDGSVGPGDITRLINIILGRSDSRRSRAASRGTGRFRLGAAAAVGNTATLPLEYSGGGDVASFCFDLVTNSRKARITGVTAGSLPAGARLHTQALAPNRLRVLVVPALGGTGALSAGTAATVTVQLQEGAGKHERVPVRVLSLRGAAGVSTGDAAGGEQTRPAAAGTVRRR